MNDFIALIIFLLALGLATLAVLNNAQETRSSMNKAGFVEHCEMQAGVRVCNWIKP